jgi:hypothetical protein
MSQFHWWGYLHINGSIQAKRYFDQQDIDEAHTSPFVARVHGPFPAKNRDNALQILGEAFF